MKNKTIRIALAFLFGLVVVTPVSMIVLSCSNGGNNQQQKPVVPNNLVDLNVAGGTTTSGIVASGYKNTIELLNLRPSTDITTLSNDLLTSLLTSHNGYQNLAIEIQNNSNQANGQLIIRLFGTYNEKSYDEIITLSGFEKNNIDSTFIFSKPIEYDSQLWFDNFQPISGVNTNLTYTNNRMLLLEIFKKCEVQFTINNNLVSYQLDNLPNTIALDSIDIDDSSGKTLLNITFKKQLYIYENNQWVIDQNSNVIRLKTTNDNSFLIPSFNDLKSYILNQLELDHQRLNNYYASYFYGNYVYDANNGNYLSDILDFFKNPDDLINRYKNKYCPNIRLYLSVFNQNGMTANDDVHSLNFTISLIDSNHSNDYNINRNFNYDGFKNINDFNQNIKNEFYLKENSSLAKTIKDNYREQINQALNGNTNYSEIDKLPSNIVNVYNKDTFNSNNIQQLNNLFNSMQLFGNDFSIAENLKECLANTLNADTSLFTITNKNDTFLVNNIRFSKDTNLKMTFSQKSAGNGVNVDIETELSIGLEGTSVTQPANIHISFLTSDLNLNDQSKKQKTNNYFWNQNEWH